jgi:RNA polymerase sigma-70 factor (ECF subfamily)
MNDEWLTVRFEGNRGRLRAMAYRMLGSASDAEDAVQEAWIRAAGAGADGVANLDGWFTTIVTRVCLDMLRSRKSRREELAIADVDAVVPGAVVPSQEGPEQEALLADSVGLALLVVLDTLAPAERVAFVLHDMFGVPFGEIAEITGRSADAARQLASRARRRVRGADPASSGPAVPGSASSASAASGTASAVQRAVSGAAVARQRAVADAFLAASRSGDLSALLAVLDPDVVLRADAAAVPPGAPAMLRGAAAVARGARAAAARSHQSVVALVNGVPGIVYAPRGRVAVVLAFTFSEDLISGIEVIADPARLEALELAVPD